MNSMDNRKKIEEEQVYKAEMKKQNQVLNDSPVFSQGEVRKTVL